MVGQTREARGRGRGENARAGAVLIQRAPRAPCPCPQGMGQGCASKVSTQGHVLHPKLLCSISLHKEKQISSSRALPGEQTHTTRQAKTGWKTKPEPCTHLLAAGTPQTTPGAPANLLCISRLGGFKPRWPSPLSHTWPELGTGTIFCTGFCRALKNHQVGHTRPKNHSNPKPLNSFFGATRPALRLNPLSTNLVLEEKQPQTHFQQLHRQNKLGKSLAETGQQRDGTFHPPGHPQNQRL